MKTITALENELKNLRKERAKGKYENGMFGITACKESIIWKINYTHKDIQDIYAELVQRALSTEWGFNELMIIACEELMTEQLK